MKPDSIQSNLSKTSDDFIPSDNFIPILILIPLLHQLIKSLFVQMYLAINTNCDSDSVPAHLRLDNSKDQSFGWSELKEMR